MADWAVSRLGQANGAGATDALFLKIFTGEVLTVFNRQSVMLDKQRIRTIPHGKTASFNAIGQTTAHYHTPGTELVGQAIKQNELTVNIDALLVSDVSIANIDEAMNHYEVRSEYSNQCGLALARAFDTNCMKALIRAARSATPIVTGGSTGAHINDAAAATTADNLKSAIFAAVQNFDEKYVPADGRFAILRPVQYYMLVQDTDVINGDWSPGNGSLATGNVSQLGGIALIKAAQLPSDDTAAAVTGENNRYWGDYSVTTAIVGTRQAIGTVKLLDLATESEYSVARQATLVVAKYSYGTGILRPECAYEIRTGDPNGHG